MLARAKHFIRPKLLGVRRDPATGHLYYPVEGRRLYIRFPEESLREKYRLHWFERIYFRHYMPAAGACVVDIGAGIGMEAVMLAAREPDLRYIAVEIQPWVYECLSLTFAQLPDGYQPFGLAISKEPGVRIAPTREGLDASIVTDHGAVPVEAITWESFVARHRIDRIDLLKMNIEGAEADLLDHADLERVDRVVVAVHDFRADRGEGEHFRTRQRVEDRLKSAGYTLRQLEFDWIFAARP